MLFQIKYISKRVSPYTWGIVSDQGSCLMLNNVSTSDSSFLTKRSQYVDKWELPREDYWMVLSWTIVSLSASLYAGPWHCRSIGHVLGSLAVCPGLSKQFNVGGKEWMKWAKWARCICFNLLEGQPSDWDVTLQSFREAIGSGRTMLSKLWGS